jgi:hypothetical protein
LRDTYHVRRSSGTAECTKPKKEKIKGIGKLARGSYFFWKVPEFPVPSRLQVKLDGTTGDVLSNATINNPKLSL